jgi:hypothetical protein
MPRRVLASHAPEEAFAPMSRVILARLGYMIVDPGDVAVASGTGSARPDLRLVDERRLSELPADDPPVPIVLLTGRKGADVEDPRVRGALRRPAGIQEVYRLLQELLEDNPRSSPRITVDLRARCSREDREWEGGLRSISENGCLLRTPEPLGLGAVLCLSFELPGCGRVEIEGEVAYHLLPDVGVIFNASVEHRETIARYVNDTLAAA